MRYLTKSMRRAVSGMPRGLLRAWSQTEAARRRLRHVPPCVEAMESRRLLSASITEFPALPDGQNGAPTQITVGSDNNLWFTEPAGNAIGVLNPTTHAVSQISLATTLVGADPRAITATGTGSNGAIWFTVSAASQFGMINPNNIASPPTIYSGAGEMPGGAGITSIGDDLWLALPSNNAMGLFNLTSKANVTPYSLSPANINVPGFNSAITVGTTDGNIWFTAPGAIGIFNPTSHSVSQVPLPNSNGTQIPSAIAAGPNGTIWFTESVPNASGTGFVSSAVGVISTATDTLIKEIATPASSQPGGITQGPDGNMWFTESGAAAIGVVNASTDQIAATLAIPTNVVSNPQPAGITTGPDGNLWFADKSGAIGKVTLTAQFVVIAQPPLDVSVGAPFGFSVMDEYVPNAPDFAFNGSVTASLSSNPVGATLGGTLTTTASQGVATFSNLSLNRASNSNGYILQAASDGVTAVNTSVFYAVAGPATYLHVTAQPTGTIRAGSGFSVTVQDLYASGPVDTAFSGTVTIALSSNPGRGTLVGNLSVAAVNGVATFSPLSLDNAGTGYTLQVSASGAATTTTLPFNVEQKTAPSITGALAVLSQKRNKRGKPVGKTTLAGYTINFSTTMNQAAIGNPANYQVEMFVAKKVHKKKIELLQPIGFTVTGVSSSSVTLSLAGKQKFPKGGQITVIASGIEDASGIFLAGNGVFTISPGGKAVTLVS